MSYFKHRDRFYIALIIIGLIFYFVFDVDFYSLSWPVTFGIFGGVMSLYLTLVQMPGINEELIKQKEINEHLSEQINDLKDKIRYSTDE